MTNTTFQNPVYQFDVVTTLHENEVIITWLDADDRMWATDKLSKVQVELLDDEYNYTISKYAPQLIKQCPICLTNELDFDVEMNAISRTDDTTVICNECGIAEAMEDL